MSIGSLANETVIHIIDSLEWSSVNPFARSCRRHAELIRNHILQIADTHVVTVNDKLNHNGAEIAVASDKLPNGLNHGFTRIYNSHKILAFRAKYIVGQPAHFYVFNRRGRAWAQVGSPIMLRDDRGDASEQACTVVITLTGAEVSIPILRADTEVIFHGGEKVNKSIPQKPIKQYLVDDEIGDSAQPWAIEHLRRLLKVVPALSGMSLSNHSHGVTLEIGLAMKKHCPGWFDPAPAIYGCRAQV